MFITSATTCAAGRDVPLNCVFCTSVTVVNGPVDVRTASAMVASFACSPRSSDYWQIQDIRNKGTRKELKLITTLL